ncbi:group II intron maturase-specific domain-containing protein [Nonomuraea muscovyensis]
MYCKDANGHRNHGSTEFTFLEFTFRSRPALARNGGTFMSFQPAISKDALKKISGEVRTWRLDHRIGSTFAQLAKAINPIVGGWMQYYGAFYQTALYSLLARINSYLVRWIRHKYRRLKTVKKALRAYYGATRAYPAMFRHWRWNPNAWRTG